MKWTEEEVARAVMMRRGGYSAQLIADALGFTRNAVIGKMHRLDEPAVGQIYTKKTPRGKSKDRWSDSLLTETWEARKARLARERAA